MQGMMTVFWKELADDFTSKRFVILFLVVLFVVGVTIYVAAQTIREEVVETRFVFLMLFTTSGGNLPAFFNFIFIISFLMPIIGIALGFDAINSERNNGTLSRLLSQPIYRDSVINGKFLAGVVTIAIMLSTIVLLVAGIGLNIIGVAPTAEEILRLLTFLGIATVYGAFWLALAMLFSIFFQRVATSALASIAVWIFFFFFVGMLAGVIANFISPAGETQLSQLKNAEVQIMVSRFSPVSLFQEATTRILVPAKPTIEQVLRLQAQAASKFFHPSPLSFSQSLLIVWPHLVSLLALTVICFAISYTKFMREEIRST